MDSHNLSQLKLKPSPFIKAGFLNKIFFVWIFPLVWKGKKKDLQYDDIYETAPELNSRYLGNRLTVEWDKELKKTSESTKRPSLVKALIRVFYKESLRCGVHIFLEECLSKTAQPVLLGLLLRYFDSGVDYTRTHGYLYALGVILTAAYFVLSHHPAFFHILMTNVKIRVACSVLLYRKALRLSQGALGESTVGQVVNLLSNDIARLDQCTSHMHYIWTSLIQIGLVILILWGHFGPACLSGVAVLGVFIPFESLMGRLFAKLRLSVAGKTDYRIRIMNEIVNGIRIIKMYAWEGPFSKMVADSRKNEIKIIGKALFVRAFNISFYYASSKIIVFVTLLTYIYSPHLSPVITAEKVFVTLALFQNIRVSICMNFPQGVSQLAETMVSLKRIENFLLLEEYKPQPITRHPQSSNIKSKVELKNVTVQWDTESSDLTLENVTLKVTEQELFIVVGSVGSGKSSLLQVILRELPILQGELKVHGSIAYVPQESWVFSGTVRDNILFGLAYQANWYRTVVDACALREDFESFEFGDKSIVGDKGISLSGGQKARLNLARAVYANSDIYLLDDPLSAVDSVISRHLFEKCICRVLKNKTTILVTHQVQYLSQAKEILLLHNGRVVSQGTYADLQSQDVNLHDVIATADRKASFEKKSENNTLTSSCLKELVEWENERRDSSGCTAEDEEESIISYENIAPTEEQKTTGKLKAGAYWKYFHSGTSVFFLVLLVLANFIAQILYTGSDYWLQLWIKHERNLHPPRNLFSFLNFLFPKHTIRSQFILFYSALILGLVIMSIIRTFMFFKMCMNSSVALHHRLFYGVLRAPMAFFDENPVGRILNRFTKDIGTIDELLPITLSDTIELSLQIIGVVVVVSIVNPYFLIPAGVIGIFFYILRNFYQCSARNLKRLEGTARSPVYSHLSTSLSGLTIIRAFGSQKRFEEEFYAHVDLHSSTHFLFIASARWLGVVIDWITVLYISFVMIGVVLLKLDAASAGLAISSAISLTRQLQWGVRQSAEAENQMVATERVLEYSEIVPEAALESSQDKKPPDTWPSKGEIEIKNLRLAYGNGAPFLKNISCVIHSLEKVGIVGRSGAGKTSFTSALFRLTEPSVGSLILIDGINVVEIGLGDLRSKISIIPQDPVLFLGSLRFNFDPLGEFTDAEIWKALQDVHLFDMVKELSIGLDAMVHEGGSNLSLGQRQLICMGRATLRRNKILVMDEATASVDPETDALIQKTIRQNFVNCTVLTVAHRLQTVIDSDKIMVLDAGTILEFDEPYHLLQDHSGGLYKFIQETGKESAEELYNQAKAHSESKKALDTSGKVVE